ncbi:hypothetical protein LWI28_009862 [Acer negundo]|uniref:Uncharacterized protein n=1 Tax=Acer negundo TaxID=4023 RepID=A0AAD5JMM5_ACENE|nr:hypothetical protein LWI28_009862 [Acer negundo]
MEHLKLVFEILLQHQLFVKLSKCAFGVSTIEYLCHIVSREEVSADPSKLLAVSDWPIPILVKSLRGFLGLTGYYKKFIPDYGKLSHLLTQLTKKNGFKWSAVTTEGSDNKAADALSRFPVSTCHLKDNHQLVVLDADQISLNEVPIIMSITYPYHSWMGDLKRYNEADPWIQQKMKDMVYVVNRNVIATQASSTDNHLHKFHIDSGLLKFQSRIVLGPSSA